MAGSTHKIVGIATVSRTEHRVAQTRELECTRRVLPQVIQRGLQVSEVAHDHQVQVKKYVREELHLKNSSDTWHGTKGAAKAMNKIAQGPLYKEGTTWFRQLSDKRRSTKTHLYWAMKNCDGTGSDLQKRIMNIIPHYQLMVHLWGL
jgi:hypothetical protein